MLHLLAYRGNVGIGLANVSIPLIVGSAETPNSSNQEYPPVAFDLIWAASFGTNITTPRISTPTLREMGPHYIRPFNIATPFGSNFAFDDISDHPLRLKALEGIDVQATSADAGVQAATVLLGCRIGAKVPIPNGEYRRIRCTSATTLTANAWTTCPLTFVDTLPTGTYAVIGLQGFGATMYAARFSFPGPSNNWRPGVPMVQTIGQRVPAEQRYCDMGVFGYFNQASLPTIEVLGTAADVAQEFEIECVKVGAQPLPM